MIEEKLKKIFREQQVQDREHGIPFKEFTKQASHKIRYNKMEIAEMMRNWERQGIIRVRKGKVILRY